MSYKLCRCNATECTCGDSVDRACRALNDAILSKKPEEGTAPALRFLGKFKKADDGKPRPDLIPVELLIEMGKVMKHGADKYGADNWKNCEDPKRYEAAVARHWLAYLSGEELDSDSGLSHLAHCACSLGMLFGIVSDGAVTRVEADENAKGKV